MRFSGSVGSFISGQPASGLGLNGFMWMGENGFLGASGLEWVEFTIIWVGVCWGGLKWVLALHMGSLSRAGL